MSWSTCSLNDVLIKTENINPNIEPNRVFKYVDVSSVSKERLLITEPQIIRGVDAPSRARKLIKTDDVIFATVRPTLRRVAIVPSHLNDEVCSTGYFVLRSNGKVLPKFIFYYLLRTEFLDEMEKLQTGASYPAVTDKQVKEQIISYPSIPIQQKIVSKLDEIFAEIDKAKAAAEANAKNAEALFQSYLTEVFERDREGWIELQIKDLGKVITGNTPKTSEVENYGNFISFVKPGDFYEDGTIDLEKQKLSQTGMLRSRVIKEKSALMVCIGATIGKCGFTDVEVVTNQQINSVTPIDKFNHKFIYLQMLTNDFQKRVIESSGQATLPIINKTKWEALTLKFPNIDKQINIVDRFNLLRYETDNLKISQINKVIQGKSLKQSILKQAFNGELVKE